MSESSYNQQPKSEPKWQGITSFVLGIIIILADSSIVISYSGILNTLSSGCYAAIIGFVSLCSLFTGWLFAIVGFILGIIGLKYIKMKLAIIGIILSTIGFGAYIYLFIMVLRIGQA